jgi:hypothetical protein
VVKSLAEAYVFPGKAWPRLIYDGDRLVGFVMAFLDMPWGPSSNDLRSGLWRLNIAANAQGNDYGRFAVEAAACAEIRARGGRPGIRHLGNLRRRSGEVLPEAGLPADRRAERWQDRRRPGLLTTPVQPGWRDIAARAWHLARYDRQGAVAPGVPGQSRQVVPSRSSDRIGLRAWWRLAAAMLVKPARRSRPVAVLRSVAMAWAPVPRGFGISLRHR